MHDQLRAVLNHPVVSGVWLIGWNPPLAGGSYQVSWAAYNGGEDHWTARQHLAEAVQVEAGGSSEVVITAPTSGGITAISNSPIVPGEKQIERTRISATAWDGSPLPCGVVLSGTAQLGFGRLWEQTIL